MPMKENWQKMEVKQPSPSVISRLMGLDDLPMRQPVQKKARVLSEDYLQRVAFIGIRQKSAERYTFNMTIDEQKECDDVFKVVEALNRDNHKRMFRRKREAHLSSLEEEKLYIRQKDMVAKREVDERLQSLKKCQEARNIFYSKADSLPRNFQQSDFFSKKLSDLKAVPFHLQLRQKLPRYCCSQGISLNSNEGLCFPSPSSGVKPARQRSRFSKQVTRKVGNGRNRLGNYALAKEPELKITTSDVLSYSKNNLNCLDTLACEAQKKTHERWKTSKRVQQFEPAKCREALGEILVFPDKLSLSSNGYDGDKCGLNNQVVPYSGDLSFNSHIAIISEDKQTDVLAGISTPRNSHQSLSSGYVTAKGPYVLVQSMPGERVSNHEDGLEYFKIQDISERKSLSSYDSSSDPEENYQPSPESVLETLHKKENSFSSDYFKSINASLIGMQAEVDRSEISDAYSEGSCVVSGDEDNGQESVGDLDKNDDRMRMFEGKESRDFSYLVDILAEAGFHKSNRALDPDSWAISSYVFEALEKKYGEQIMWKKPERRLLFDRINSGLMELWQLSMGIPAWTKSVGRRFSFGLGEEAIEEELWMILVCQEKEASMDSEKVLRKDDKWMDLRDDIQVVGQEIGNSLMDELVEDAVRVSVGSL